MNSTTLVEMGCSGEHKGENWDWEEILVGFTKLRIPAEKKHLRHLKWLLIFMSLFLHIPMEKKKRLNCEKKVNVDAASSLLRVTRRCDKSVLPPKPKTT